MAGLDHCSWFEVSLRPKFPANRVTSGLQSASEVAVNSLSTLCLLLPPFSCSLSNLKQPSEEEAVMDFQHQWRWTAPHRAQQPLSVSLCKKTLTEIHALTQTHSAPPSPLPHPPFNSSHHLYNTEGLIFSRLKKEPLVWRQWIHQLWFGFKLYFCLTC